MTVWLMSVLGTGILGAVINHLTAGTRMHGAVRTACVYAFVLAVIFPVPMIISGNYDALSCDYGDSTYDEDIADVTDEAYFALAAEALDAELAAHGYDTSSVVEGTVYADKATVTRVVVTLYGEFADSSSEIVRVGALVSEYFGTDISAVYVYVGENKE